MAGAGPALRVAFLGNAAWSVPSLRSIARSRHPVAAVVTRAPTPAGRGHRPTPTPVADEARRLDLPLAEVATVRDGEGSDALAAARPAVLAVVAYGEILPRRVLEIPAVAPVNLHFSILPALRGAAPVQRAILEGLTRTGVTTMRMDEGLDTGPIMLQQEADIGPDEDAGSLGGRLAELGADLLVRTLDGLADGGIEERPQAGAAATYAPKVTAEERVIDWARPAVEVARRVRALAPVPGASTRFRGKHLKVLRVSPLHLFTPPVWAPPPGMVFVATGERFPAPRLGAVAGGGQVVSLDEVQLEGRRRMTGEEFVRGYRPEPDERLG